MNTTVRMTLAAMIPLILIVSMNSCLEEPRTVHRCCPSWPFVYNDPTGTPPEISTISDTMDIDGTRLYLSSELWRNFMPMTPPDCTSLVAYIKIIDCDSTAIPQGVEVECVWVINGGKVWSSWLADEGTAEADDYEMAMIARCGPAWDVDTEADVIVRVKYEGDSNYIRQTSVEITKVE